MFLHLKFFYCFLLLVATTHCQLVSSWAQFLPVAVAVVEVPCCP